MMQVSPGGKGGTAPHVTSYKLERPQRLLLSPLQAHILETHSERIRSWGWAWTTPLHMDTQPSAPADAGSPASGSIGHKPCEKHGNDACRTQGYIPGHGAEPLTPSALHQSAPDQDFRPGLAPAGSCLDDRASDDDDESGPMAEAALTGGPARQMNRAAKRRRLGGPNHQQTKRIVGDEQDAQQSVQARLQASATDHKPLCSGVSCSEIIEAGSISLTHLACVLGTALNAMELQVGAV